MFLKEECRVRNWFQDPMDPGTMALTTHRAPKHHFHHKQKRPDKVVKVWMQVPMIIFDEDALYKFFRASARAKVLGHHVQLAWKTLEPKGRLDRFLFLFDRFVFWKDSLYAGTKREPGTLVMSFGDESKIDEEIDKTQQAIMKTYDERMNRSVESAVHFLNEQDRDQSRYVKAIQDAYEEWLKTNEEKSHEMRKDVAVFIAVKLEATILVKTIAYAEKAAKAFFIDMGYDVTTSVAEEIRDASKAKLAFVVGKEALKDKLRHESEHAPQLAAKMEAKLEAELLKSEGKKAVRELWEDLLKDSVNESEKKVLTELLKKEVNRAALGGAISRGIRKGLKKALPKTVKGLWLGAEILEALNTARKELDEYSE